MFFVVVNITFSQDLFCLIRKVGPEVEISLDDDDRQDAASVGDQRPHEDVLELEDDEAVLHEPIEEEVEPIHQVGLTTNWQFSQDYSQEEQHLHHLKILHSHRFQMAIVILYESIKPEQIAIISQGHQCSLGINRLLLNFKAICYLRIYIGREVFHIFWLLMDLDYVASIASAQYSSFNCKLNLRHLEHHKRLVRNTNCLHHLASL